MKKFLLGILLPVLTLVTIIGTGFATWYFDTNLTTSSKTTNTSVNVAAVATVGAINVTSGSNAKLTLDQKNPSGAGIKLSENIVATYTAYSANLNGQQDAGDVKITIKVTFDSNQAIYVGMDGKQGWTKDLTDKVNTTYVKEIVAPTTSATLTSTDFSYTDEPKDTTAYGNMRKAFEGKTISVVFTATATKQTN